MAKEKNPLSFAAIQAIIAQGSKPELTGAHYSGINCFCCGLPISDKMIEKSEGRANRSTKKPARKLQGGVLDGQYVCKQCVLPAAMGSLTLSKGDPDTIAAEYRKKVMERFELLLTEGSVDKRRILYESLTLNYGTWMPHMRMPNHASIFWVYLNAMTKMNKESK